MGKKFVYGASAACLALAIPFSAQADDMPGISMSGHMNHDFGFGSYVGGDEALDDFHMEIDAEIKFTATGTTDGGLTVTAAMEFDADSGGGVDESHLTIAGGFGSIILGEQDNASNRHGNKGVGGGYGGGGYYDCGETWTPASCGGPPAGGGDALGIQYDTPSIGGFQAGISFQPETDALGSTGTANDSNIIAVGANFSGDFAGTSLTIGANHVSLNPGGDGDTKKQWGLGAAVGIGSTTLSLRYDAKPDANENALTGAATDTTSFGIGIDHTIGALSFGIGYGTTKDQSGVLDGVKTAMHHNATTTADLTGDFPRPMPGDPNPDAITDQRKALDRSSSMISLGATYDLGGGVKISAGINSGKMKSMQVNSNPSPVFACVEGRTPVEGKCYRDADLEGGYYVDGEDVKSATTGDAIELQDTDEHQYIISHSLTYAVKDIDDVGIGFRIAFSF